MNTSLTLEATTLKKKTVEGNLTLYVVPCADMISVKICAVKSCYFSFTAVHSYVLWKLVSKGHCKEPYLLICVDCAVYISSELFIQLMLAIWFRKLPCNFNCTQIFCVHPPPPPDLTV